MRKFRKIISGGQTGVDRAALDAAIDLSFECGGWCPEGRLAEDGTIPARYPLIELTGAGYEERTLKNLIESDGTAVLYFSFLSGGSKETVDWCKARSKAVKSIDATVTGYEEAIAELGAFLSETDIEILNVAGPRASKQPAAYDYAYKVVTGLIKLNIPLKSGRQG